MGIFELEMRPGKQLFPLNYNNIFSNKDIKYNIKAIKLIVRETYGGNRTYINQIMFYEQTAEEVKDLICSNELNKVYKLNKKLLGNNSSNKLKNNSKKDLRKNNNYFDRNSYNSEQIKNNKTQIIKFNNNINNNQRKISKKNNKTFEERQEESDIYKTSDITNGRDDANYNQIYKLNSNNTRNNKSNKKMNDSKIKKEKKLIEITPITKKPNRQIKTDIKNSGKNKDNLTPNKYLKRIKNLTKGNNTTNANSNIQFGKNFGFTLKDNNNSYIKKNLENNMFNTSINDNSDIKSSNNNYNRNNYEENINPDNEIENSNEQMSEEEEQKMNSIQIKNEFRNTYNHNINGQNNNYNNPNFEFMEENISNISDNRKKMNKTHDNINYSRRDNNIFNNLPNIKSHNNSNILTEQNQNEMSINSNNNYSQRFTAITKNENYYNMNKNKTILIKKKLDYLEGNILEIKKTLQEISEGFSFCISKEFIINNFKEQILSICEEIYNEYYPYNNSKNNTNPNEEKNGNESLMTNSNYISQNENNKIEVELEKQINEKLEEKLGSLQNNIFDKYLKPTINKIGDSMKKNIEQIQLEVDNIDKQNINDISKEKEKEAEDLSYKLSTSKIRNQKFDEINKIGERLYNKLLEKEKKLKLLKQEKAKFLIEGKEIE